MQISPQILSCGSQVIWLASGFGIPPKEGEQLVSSKVKCKSVIRNRYYVKLPIYGSYLIASVTKE